MENIGTYKVEGDHLPLESGIFYKYDSPEYSHPTPDNVRQLLKQAGITGSKAASIVGVHGRTIRKWTAEEGSPNHRTIPYAAWRLLLIEAGLDKN